jgi:hypothetical protein
MLCQVPSGLRHHAEMGRAFDPAHLDCSRHNNPTGLSCILREDVCKVIAIGLPNDEAPETITDIEFQE